VNCSARDAHGNTSTGSFTITVSDTRGPLITVSNQPLAEATGATGATVNYAPVVSAFDSVDGNVPVSCTPAAGSTFPIGVTPVVCTAVDAHRNSTSRSFPVMVQDTTPPVLTVPSDITSVATSFAGATVALSASAIDLVDGTRPVACTPASGSMFPIGTTTVRCSAADSRGNSASRTLTVTVTFTYQQAHGLLLNLIRTIRSGDIPAACAQLTGVINVIQAQVGIRFTQSEATALIRLATDAKRTFGCQ